MATRTGTSKACARAKRNSQLRIAEVDVKIAALEAIMGTLAKPLEELDTGIETELTRLALTIAKHLVRRELKLDPDAGHRHHPAHGGPAAAVAARNIKVHLHPDDAAIVREKLARAGRANANGSSPRIRSWRAAAAASPPTTASIDARVESSVAAAMRGLLGDDRAERVDAAVAAADPPPEEDRHERRRTRSVPSARSAGARASTRQVARAANLPSPPVEGSLTRMVGLALEASGCQAAVGDVCDLISGDGSRSKPKSSASPATSCS